MANCLQVGRVTPCAPQFVFARTAGRGLPALPIRVHPCPSVVKMALPDLIEIVPLDKPVRAEITVPGSKSITNRALILAALADGETILTGALWSEDTQIMVECLQDLGFMVNVAPDPDEICNRTITVYGQGGTIPGGGTVENPLELFVGNAGTAARFLAALVCLGKGVYRLHGVPRMHERPQAALFKALRELGYRVDSPNDKLPATIFGGRSRLSTVAKQAEDARQRVPTVRNMHREHRGKFAICVGAAALCKTRRLGSRSGRRECRGIALCGDDFKNDRSVSEQRREISNRAGCFERELFLGG